MQDDAIQLSSDGLLSSCSLQSDAVENVSKAERAIPASPLEWQRVSWHESYFTHISMHYNSAFCTKHMVLAEQE